MTEPESEDPQTAAAAAAASADNIIAAEVLGVKKLIPSIKVVSTPTASPSLISANYRRGYAVINITLNFPSDYPKNPVAVNIENTAIIPSGLKKTLIK